MDKSVTGKQKRIRWLAVCAAICIFAVCIVWSMQQHNQKQQLQENQQELITASGMYNSESIVLPETTAYKAEKLAALLGARLRMTEDGTYAVLYLPEGMVAEDVYANPEYQTYLSDMALDYYVDLEAVDANNRQLVSARPSFVVTDEMYPQQNYLDYINLRDTWNYTRGAGITVAVIDSGIDTDHPDFAGRISSRSYDASNDRRVSDYGLEVIEDEDGHGTSVAGVIAAGMNDGVGITGIAPEVELIVIKCETDGKGQFLRSSDLVFGLAYAIECDADVVNMSFGTPFNSFARYTQLAVDSDIICVAAAGNDGSAMPVYPAADENVIAVGALDMTTWGLASYSNYGFSLVLAPGTAYTTALEGGYNSATGTSISAPVVTSAVALYLSQNPYTEFPEMCELLKASSIDLGILGEDRQHAFGALDIHALVCQEKGTITYEMLTNELKSQTQIFVKGHTIQYMPEPERANVVLDGWYHDIECTDEVAYFENVFTNDVTLYAAWINEDDGTAYTYRELEDGTVEISSYTGRRRYLTVPNTLAGKPVTSIGEYAFAGNSRLRSVTLPDSLVNISQFAFFNCSKLRSIEVPENVASIGEYAFNGCVSMSQVSLTKNSALTTIGDQAFGMCGISTFHLPRKVSSLGEGVFYGSTGMTSVSVEAGNQHYQVLNSALYDAAGTTLLYYPAGLSGVYTVSENTMEIAPYAFAQSRCTNVILSEGLLTMGDCAFMGSYIRTAELPASLTNMGASCYCSSFISALILPDDIALTQIPKRAFCNCAYLSTITIPAGVQSIGEEAFISSTIRSVTFASNSQIKAIGATAFAYTPLTSISFPASLAKIGNEAFTYCGKLSSVSWESGSSLTSIGREAFLHCTTLKVISLPDSLTNVDYRAFYGSGLQEITIGANLVDLGGGAFSGCQNLQNINVAEGNAAFTSVEGVVFSKDGTVLHMFPAGRNGTYAVPTATVELAEFAFAEADDLTTITLNEGLTEIGGYAFSWCSSLTTPVLPASLTTIGENAFEYCSSMAGSLTIPKGVISIGRFAFFQDYALTSIVIEPESELSRIGYGTFGYCGITNFTVPGNVSSMGQEVFTGCKNLLTVTFEADSQLEAIAAWTFSGAEELRQITFEEGSALKLLEARSLEGLRKLERVTLENCTQLTTIDNYAFQNCPSLAEVTLPASLEEIGRYAFAGCSSLSRVDLPASVAFIGRYAFLNTNNLNVYFAASVLPANLEENWDHGIAGYYVSTAQVVTSGDWQYALTNDGKVSIVAYTGSESNIDLTTLDGHEIISIGGYAFADNTALQSITLPDTLQGVYQYAFKGTTGLRDITIPASVTVVDNGAFQGSGVTSVTFAEGSALVNLGRYAFADTANLTGISIPDSVAEIRDYAFQGSGLAQIIFGESSSLKEIGRYAFQGSGLTSVTLPAALEKIDYDAFRDCAALTAVDMSKVSQLQIFGNAFYGAGLTSVDIPAGVGYIGEFCFTGCQNLTAITVDAANESYASLDGVLYNKDMTKLITCPAGITGSYTVPASVATLGFAAFEGSRLSEVIFPEDSQLVTLGYRVFYNCDNLTAITVPDSVQSIGNYAFAYCDNLKGVTFGTDSQLGGIYEGAFYNNVSLTAFALPDGVQEISDYAFYGCAALTDLTYGEDSQLKGIYDYAFAYSGVTELVMPDGLLEIGTSAFQGAKLATLQCNDALMVVGDYAFADCGLADTTILEFPGTVEYMGYAVLKGAVAIDDLTIPFLGRFENDEATHALKMLFSAGDELFAIGNVTVLRGDIPASAFQTCKMNSLTLPQNTTKIGMAAFFDAEVSKVTIPDGVVSIERSAFEYARINRVELPKSLQTVGERAFSNSTLQEIELPEGLISVGEAAFEHTNITEVSIGALVQEIGGGVFSGCGNLADIQVDENNPYYTAKDGILYTKNYSSLLSAPGGLEGAISVPDGVKEISNHAFYYCDKITEVSLPDTLETIGDYAFSACYVLETINIPPNVTYLGDDCFSHCERLSGEVVIPNQNVQLGSSLFYGCHSLERLVLPEGITVVPIYLAYGCHSLKQITIPSTVTDIQNMAFNDCISLEELTIPANVTYIGEAVLSGCTSLTAINVAEGNPVYASVDGILYNADKTQILSVPGAISGHVTIPDGIKTIGAAAFRGCTKLERITIPDSVEEIQEWAFASCESLSTIEIGSGIKSISRQAFSPGTAYWANANNWVNGVLYIGNYVIDWHEAQNVVFREGTTVIGSGNDNCAEYIWMPDSVSSLSQYAFLYQTRLKAVRISKNLQTVYGAAFNDCPLLYSLNFPDDVIHVGFDPFAGLSNIQYLKGGAVENSYTNDGLPLFISAPNLKTLYIPYSANTTLGSTDGSPLCKRIVISTTGNMSTTFLQNIEPDTVIYCYVEEETSNWPTGWNQGCTTYYKDEWHLATFYADDIIVTMDPLANGEVVQVPAESLVAELLRPGAQFLGWDINGDGLVDEIPATLTEDLEAHAVLSVAVSGIALEETEATMEVTDEKVLDVIYTPDYYTTGGELVWTSSDETVATVDETGKVTALAEGEVTITATLAANSEISASCVITVIPLQPGIRLEETAGELVLGKTFTLEPRYVLLEEVMDTLAFTSSDETVAAVDAAGVITAVAPGTAEITISCGEYTAVYTVTVVVPMEGISLSADSDTMNVDDVMVVTPTFTPENTTDDKTLTWTSSDSTLATVSAAGEVTAVAPGTVTITAKTAEGLTAEYTITIKAPIQWITLNTTVGTMRIDRIKPLEVIYQPSNTTDDKTATWSSSNPDVAAVDANGVVTAFKAGTSVITGTVGEHSATYTVTVVGLKDTPTGIIVTNSDDTPMDADVGLVVDPVDNYTLEQNNAGITDQVEQMMGDSSDGQIVMNAYDITLQSDGETVQPETAVDVDIPVEEEMQTEDLTVFRVEDDGSLTRMSTEFAEDFASFQTDHFSLYILAGRSTALYPDQVTLNETEVQLCPGKELQLTATILPAETTKTKLSWHTDNPTVATVSDGTVTTIGEGTAVITVATENGLTASCTVTVKHTEVTDEEVDATCTDTGLTEGKHCSVCGEVLVAQTVIPAKGHTEVIDKKVDATCTDTGLTEGKHCSVCGKVLVAQTVIPAKGHTEVIDKKVDATCTDTGLTEGKHCSVCGEVLVAQTVIPAKGHTEVIDKKVEATCTDTGMTEGKHCSVCGEVLVAQETVAALGHIEIVGSGKEPTCTESGISPEKHCERCSETLAVEETLPALGHNWDSGTVTLAPTETDTGIMTYTCQRCAETREETLPVVEHVHKYATNTKPATCTQQGYTEYICVCGDTYVDYIDATGHTEVIDPAVVATCDAVGYTEGSHCAACGKVFTAQQKIPAMGHVWDEGVETLAPADYADGIMTYTCTVCGEVKTAVIPALEHIHSYTAAVTAPGCESQGYTTFTCSCGDSYVDSMTDALGHSAVTDASVEATCTTPGKTEGFHCSVCGKVLTAQILTAPLGHSWDEGTEILAPTDTEEGLKSVTCQICFTSEEHILHVAGTDHTYTAEVSEPTCTAEGYTVYTCTCGDSYVSDVVPPLEHTEEADKAVEPTCTAAGRTEGIHCTVCGTVLITQELIPAPGHSWDEGIETVAAESQANGIMTYTCISCGETRTQTIPALEHIHNYIGSATAPACTDQGYTTYTCNCGDSYLDDFVDAAGHSFGEWTANGTVEEIRTCQVCGHVETREIASGNTMVMDTEELGEFSQVFIEGQPYAVRNENGKSIISLPEGDSFLMVTYTYHVGDPADIHTHYPLTMQVWKIQKDEEGNYNATRISELDNLLQYSGASIRIVGVKGIRMITSITKSNKSALTGEGLAGYTLEEYGTALCWATDLAPGEDLVLGKEYTRSNYAYKKGVADPIFAQTADLIQYTNVLVGFDDDQCIPDIVMRPYIILSDAEGNQVTLYGGSIHRSIGYIAYQNRNVFKPGNASYDYVWGIIHHVYGDQFDEDYKG